MPCSRSGLPMNAREPRISLFPITAGPADGKRPTASRPHEEQNARWLHKAANQPRALVRRSRTDNSPLRLVSKAVSSENISEYVLKADRVRVDVNGRPLPVWLETDLETFFYYAPQRRDLM
ncbi:unnamed protein product [Lasius platythorax]|uniref:Uncharacterized protein n=1 Tax=Lasius platythorax TaxID=488582 RepID=A0AAV2N5Z9_9HYME